MRRPSRFFALLVLGLLGAACGPAGGGGSGGDGKGDDPGMSSEEEDPDGDGYSAADGDCDEGNPAVNPGAMEGECDGVDDDCNGVIDDPFNADGDPYSTCAGDCDDNDPDTYPGAPELADGVDNDCDGIADNNRSDYDDDGDGYTEDEGDCDDAEPLVNPGAVEVNVRTEEDGSEVAEMVDNDCDGAVDEGEPACDGSLDPSQPMDLAKGMELCKWVSSASLTQDADPRATNLLGAFGDTYGPHAGEQFTVLSTGIAVDASHPDFVNPNGGTAFTNTAPHPDPQPDPADGCGLADPGTVNDYVELTVDLEVPSNAQSLTYDFLFVSGEFPEWVCTQYDDTFLALMESSSFNGNISFDDAGRPVTINIGFFDVCETGQGPDCTGDAELVGTGYEGTVGGGTGWLTTTAPVTPGETITLRFLVFDEGDHVYDSTVLLDNFRWKAEAVDAPTTVEREVP